jgi:hypothetical protein
MVGLGLSTTGAWVYSLSVCVFRSIRQLRRRPSESLVSRLSHARRSRPVATPLVIARSESPSNAAISFSSGVGDSAGDEIASSRTPRNDGVGGDLRSLGNPALVVGPEHSIILQFLLPFLSLA